MKIRSDTKIYGSFAKNAGNNGCKMFNAAFDYYGINAIYRSFSVDDIGKAVDAARTLNLSGFAITMPFKEEVLKHVDDLSPEVKYIGAANTVINTDGVLKAYNTDFRAAVNYLKKRYNPQDTDRLYILGNGGYSKAVQAAAKHIKWDYELITRDNWSEIENLYDCYVYNCTPVETKITEPTVEYIDCLIDTDTGFYLSMLQANYQMHLYEELPLPFLSSLLDE